MIKSTVSMGCIKTYEGGQENHDGFKDRVLSFFLWIFVIIMFVSCGGESEKSIQSSGISVTIVTPPADQAVVQGQTAVFYVTANGSKPLSYQWMRDGNDIPGATTAGYETSGLGTADDGATFSVRVSNARGSVESGGASLTVYTNTTIPAYLDYTVNPAAIDSTASNAYGPNYAAFNTNVSSKNKLFVFFPGTGGKPNVYRFIVRAAADNGYHAVGLAYPNDETVYEFCSGSDDLSACTNQARHELLTGRGGPEGYDIKSADSIEKRLQNFLIYLSEQHHEQGWDQFLNDDNTISWGSLRLAGHSQGGSQAGYIGKQYAVDRVIFFASPSDYNGFYSATESWISANGPTGSMRFYGFTNVQDNIILWSIVQQNWIRLHMDDFGEVIDIDDNDPPYNYSHRLTTNVEGDGLLPFHNVTVLDYSTPIDDNGFPSFLPVWQYLCFL